MTGTSAAHALAQGLGLGLRLERVPFGPDCADVHLASAALQRRERLVEKLLLGPGRLVAVVDAAGAGKTALLRRALARRDRPRPPAPGSSSDETPFRSRVAEGPRAPDDPARDLPASR